ncbi:MAG TPA: shikimate kinase [Bacillota bacterium]|nr:shikimate kinase [Bacillota bacterium]
MKENKVKMYGLLGRKLGHSYSSRVHTLLGNENYRHIELEPDELERFLRENAADIGGLNVTIPYKRDVAALCDKLSSVSASVGAVNTVTVRDGCLTGYNTDVFGLIYAIRRAGIDLLNKKVVIFGSGGASATAVATAQHEGAREVVVISRSGADGYNYETLNRHYDADILINTTPLGMYPSPGAAPAKIASFTSCKGVVDLIYNPIRTSFLMEAERLSIPRTDGLSMLVAQAVLSHSIFFDKISSDGLSEDTIQSLMPDIERIYKTLRTEVQNIVIIGMPGSGKSTVGALLAEITGRELVDTDEKIVSLAGMSIPEIFATEGEEGFRRREREVVWDVGMKSGAVIVTGGGVVLDKRNYAPLHQNGRIYWLMRDVSALERAGRPLSVNADIYAMERERRPHYEAFADASVENKAAPHDAARAIWEDYLENSCN